MIKDQILRLCWRSVLLASLLYFTVLPESAYSRPAWLNGWDKRVKITINSTNINATLTNFPVLIYLSTNSGENAEDVSFVFDELQSGTNRKKIAVTTGDGTTQCYVEIDDWIHTNEQAWLWAKVPNVASNTDTDLYIYYDNGRPDNTNYVGDPNSTPAENVWDTNFVMVQHMKDETTSNTLDSTSNNNDGTKEGVGEPAVTTSGQIDDAQNFDGTNDYVDISDFPSISFTSSFTLEAWVKLDAIDRFHGIFGKDETPATERSYYLIILNTNKIRMLVSESTSGAVKVYFDTTNTLSLGTWYHIVGVFTLSPQSIKIYVNGSEWAGTLTGSISSIYDGTAPLRLGSNKAYSYFLDGIMDEGRASNGSRNLAWVKASYETQRDHLLDFGIEESRPIPGTVMSIK